MFKKLISLMSILVVSSTAVATPDLVVTQTMTPTVVSAGSLVSYAVYVANNGTSTATGVYVDMVYPTGFIYSTSSIAQNLSNTVGVMRYNLGNISTGVTGSFVVTGYVYGQSGDVLTARSTASVSDEVVTGNNTAVSTGTLSGNSYQMSIYNSTGSLGSFISGENAYITFRVTNLNNRNASGVFANIVLPSNFVYSGYMINCNSGFATASCDTGNYNNVSGVWNLGNMTGNSNNGNYNKDLYIYGKFTSTGNVVATGLLYTNSDVFMSGSVLTGLNILQVYDNSVYDIGVTMTGNTTGIYGQTGRYTLTVTNYGPATGTNLVISLSNTGFAISSGLASTGVYSGSTWTIASLASGQSATLGLTGVYTMTGNLVMITNLSAYSGVQAEVRGMTNDTITHMTVSNPSTTTPTTTPTNTAGGGTYNPVPVTGYVTPSGGGAASYTFTSTNCNVLGYSTGCTSATGTVATTGSTGTTVAIATGKTLVNFGDEILNLGKHVNEEGVFNVVKSLEASKHVIKAKPEVMPLVGAIPSLEEGFTTAEIAEYLLFNNL